MFPSGAELWLCSAFIQEFLLHRSSSEGFSRIQHPDLLVDTRITCWSVILILYFFWCNVSCMTFNLMN
jgi:hypothetical protein